MKHAKNRSVSDESCTKRKKSVAWADEVGGNLECMEKRPNYGKSPDCTLPSPPSSADLDSDKMDVAKSVAVEPLSSSDSTSLSCGPVLAARLTHSPEPVGGEVESPGSNDGPISERNLLSNSPSLPSDDSPLPSCDISSSSNGSGDDSSSTSDTSICGWDSDVSDSSADDDDSETASKPISVCIFVSFSQNFHV